MNVTIMICLKTGVNEKKKIFITSKCKHLRELPRSKKVFANFKHGLFGSLKAGNGTPGIVALSVLPEACSLDDNQPPVVVSSPNNDGPSAKVS